MYILPICTDLDSLLGCVINIKGYQSICKINNISTNSITLWYKQISIQKHIHDTCFNGYNISFPTAASYEEFVDLTITMDHDFNIISHDNKLITKEMFLDIFQ